MENRRYQRVKLAAQGDLKHQGLTYPIRLENISLRGALISSEECIMVPKGDSCSLSIRLGAEGPPLEFGVEIVHSFFSMVGVQFIAFEKDAEERLSEQMERLAKEPENPGQEWQKSPVHSAQSW